LQTPITASAVMQFGADSRPKLEPVEGLFQGQFVNIKKLFINFLGAKKFDFSL
jgi:hypothetical protein